MRNHEIHEIHEKRRRGISPQSRRVRKDRNEKWNTEAFGLGLVFVYFVYFVVLLRSREDDRGGKEAAAVERCQSDCFGEMVENGPGGARGKHFGRPGSLGLYLQHPKAN